MKTLRYKLIYPLLLVFAVFVSGCDLEEELDDSVTGEAEVEAGAASLGPIYQSINAAYQGQGSAYALQMHPSDELIGPTRGVDWSDFGVWRSLHNHSWDGSHPQVLVAWNDLHQGVVRANAAIVAFKNSGNLVGAAQATFLRSFLLWQLVDFFGNIPFRDESNTDFINPPPVLTRSEATQLIISDLEGIVSVLPTKADGIYGDPTKEAAWALLSRVYLNKFIYDGGTSSESTSTAPPAEMDKVIEYVDAITATGTYSLSNGEEYFTANFGVGNESSPESIFVIKDIPNNNFGSRLYMTLHYNQNPSGWNGFTTISDFYNKWDQNDKRFKGEPTPTMQENSGLHFGFLQGQQYGQDGDPLKERGGGPLVFTEEIPLTAANESRGVRVIKYEPDYATSVQHPTIDYAMIRYAEVLLNKAEALWRKGSSPEALEILNNIRVNRGVPPHASISANGQELLDERGFELYWEGIRRTDQIRFDQFTQPWDQKSETPGHVKLFPIPQTAVDTNPNLEQNPGY